MAEGSVQCLRGPLRITDSVHRVMTLASCLHRRHKLLHSHGLQSWTKRMWEETAYLCNLSQPLRTGLPELLLLLLVINGPATPTYDKAYVRRTCVDM